MIFILLKYFLPIGQHVRHGDNIIVYSKCPVGTKYW